MTKVLIEIKGGTLQRVSSTEPIEYVLLDYDNMEAPEYDAEYEAAISREDELLPREDMDTYIESQVKDNESKKVN